MINQMIYNIKLSKFLSLAFLMICCLATKPTFAQEESLILSGIITDVYGKPISGVTVHSANMQNGTTTDLLGSYSLTINDASKEIQIYGKGYLKQDVLIGGQTTIDVQLKSDTHHQDDWVDLGYTSQRRSDISGAVSTVFGEELERSPVANLSQTFAGRLAGLTTQETFSELSRANTSLFVRGLSAARGNGPLVMIDGIICAYNSNQTLEYISANEIESVTVLKDASTQALYGIQGANGLIVIKTKRGEKGALKIKARFDQSFQQVTTKPSFFNSGEYAELRNLAAYNDGRGENYLFSQEAINHYNSGDNRELYPNNNWYKTYIKDFAKMQRASVSMTGGNDKVQFFSNINFMHQGGQFITDQPKYATNANNIWVNYRSNVDMKLNRYLTAYVRLSGNVKRERTPGYGNSSIYSSVYQLPASFYGPVTPMVKEPNSDEILSEGGQVLTTERVGAPTYGMLNRSGYYRHTVTNITSQFGLDLDMSFLTKGLKLSGVMAYQTNAVGSLGTTQNFERWIRTDDANELKFVKKGAELNTPLSYSKSHSYYYHLTYSMSLNYQRSFGLHNVGGMGYFFYQNLTKADTGSPWLLPYNRVSSGFEATYNYNKKYFLKLDLGYSGSEQYARSHRFTATPALSAAWVLSNESFLANSDVVSLFKIRASYGKTANDQSSLARFAYLDNVTLNGGGYLGYLQYTVVEQQKGNPNIRAEVSTKKNIGLDLGLFNALTFTVDLFQERMNNMIVSAYATVPEYQGVPLFNYPQTNTGKFENKGFEITGMYEKNFSKDFSINLGGMLSYAKNKVLYFGESLKTDDYVYRKMQEGYAFGQQFGYLVDYSNGNGFFNTQSELDNSPKYGSGTPRLGDFKYQDLNGDGNIDERDYAPIGNGLLPQTIYSFTTGLRYKQLDFNVQFQGIGKYSSLISGMGVFETEYDGVFGSLHRKSWTKERYENGEEITSPALSLAKSVNQEATDYWNYNRSYIRLKNLEIGYTLPAHFTRTISMEKIRIIASGQNLITWDKMKTSDFGPESSSYAAIPVYRVYNIGLSATF